MRVRRSFLLAFADKAVGVLLAVITMAVVSRLLTPAEVGLFVVASSLVFLIEAFRDFGVASFLIQEQELSRDLTRSAVTIVVLMSLLLGSVAFLSADLVAGFYDDPDLGGLIRIATLAFLAAPVSNPLLALLRRDMAFGAVAVISITATALNSGVTIGLALAGYGAYSFVWGMVLQAFVMAAGVLLVRPDWWIFRPSLRHWRQVVPFGAWSSVVTLLGMLFDALPRLILGRVLGFGAVGLFARAVSLTQLPDRLLLSAVQPVLLPTLAILAREREGLKSPFLTGVGYVTGLHWPALAMIALLADPIVRLLLGGQWLAVVPILRIVALAYFCLFPLYLCYPVLVALGRVRAMAMAMLIALPPCFAIQLAASTMGLHAMALSLFLTGPLQAVTMLWFVRRHVAFGAVEFATPLLRSAGLTLVTVAPPLAVFAARGGWDGLNVSTTALAVLGAMAIWPAGLVLTRHPLRHEL